MPTSVRQIAGSLFLATREKPFALTIKDVIAQIDHGIVVSEAELERRFLNAVEHELKARGFSPTVEQQRKIVRGREDARIGGLIFEFKKPSQRESIRDLETRKPQIDRYIDEYQSQGIILRGILTNGYRIIFIDEEKNEVESGNLDECIWMLETWVSALALKIASPSDLKSLLGPVSTVGKGFIKELYDSYHEHSTDLMVKESFEMWDGVYGCATNLNKESVRAVQKFAKNSLDLRIQTRSEAKTLLFIIETYLSVLMKLLVAEVAKQKSIVPVTSLEELLGKDLVDGYAKLSERIPFLSQLFEYDTFFWFVDLANRSSETQKKTSQYLASIISILSKMDFTIVSTDLIKHAYQGFFDSSTRRALGEFYTPDALVDEVLDAVNYRGDGILELLLLDPACGSGTFLVKAIDRFLSAVRSKDIGKDAALTKIVDRIVGVDIHPFAVAMAKVNYLLALGRLIDPSVRKTVRNLRVPIYWADSLATRSRKTEFGAAGQVMTVEVKVPVLGDFTLPDPGQIDWVNLIDVSLQAVNANWSEERFLEKFEEDQRLAYRKVLLEFLQIFRERKSRGMNGRWLSTLRNFIVVDQLKQQCDLVVGNPPWVRVHNINKDIRSELMKKFEVYKRDRKNGKVVGWNPQLKATTAPFPQQIDYCMAFVESGIDYLREGGRLGFVLSSKIMNALYANLLRRLLIERTSIAAIIDHSISNQRLFEEATNSPLVLVVDKAIPLNSSAHFTFDSFEKMSWRTNQKDIPLVASDVESPWCLAPPKIASIFRRVQKKNHRLGDIFTVHMGIKTSFNAIFLVKRITTTATKGLLAIVNEQNDKDIIEAELLQPVVRGRDIEAWRYCSPRYIIWTHDKKGLPLRALPENASQYFSKYEKKLLGRADYQKRHPPWTIYRVSKEKLGSKVGWQELSKMMEAVIIQPKIVDSLLGERLLIPIQTVYFIATGNSKLDLGLSGLLNSTFARAFISSFSLKEMGQPPRFRHFSWTVGLVPLPSDFTERKLSETLRKVIRISREMHVEGGKDRKLAEELDGYVAELYGLTSEELSCLNQYLHCLGVPTIH